jgi:hypothetical protein
MEASRPNPCPFGTFGIPPADSASRAGGMPKASRDRSLGTLAKYMKIILAVLTFFAVTTIIHAEPYSFPPLELSGTVPDSWTIVNKKEQDELIQKGSDLADDGTKELIKDYRKYAGILLMAYQYPTKSRPDNPSFTIMCEDNKDNLTFDPELVLRQTEEAFKSQNLNVTSSNHQKTTISGIECFLLRYDIHVGDIKKHIAMYAVPRKNHLLMFQLAYHDEQQLDALKLILDMVKIE